MGWGSLDVIAVLVRHISWVIGALGAILFAHHCLMPSRDFFSVFDERLDCTDESLFTSV